MRCTVPGGIVKPREGIREGIFMKKNTSKRYLAWGMIFIFVASGIVFGILQFAIGEISRGLLGLAAALFLLVPWFFKTQIGAHPYLLYIEGFAYCTLAYSVGCVYQQFDAVPMLDKVAHFWSGFVFTLLGYGIFLWLRKKEQNPIGRPPLVGVGFAVFFSSFIAVLWEIMEFLGYVFFQHDSQHHLTTGVFDTMGDLITCFVGSLLCGISVLLYLTRNVRLPSGIVAEELIAVLGQNKHKE